MVKNLNKALANLIKHQKRIEMNDNTTKVELSQDKLLQFNGFISNSFDDYLAARLLYNNFMPLQASFLASTSIEKYIKAFLRLFDVKIKKEHDLIQLSQKLEPYTSIVKTQVNHDFLTELTKAYKCRYISSLKDNFNIAIVNNKYLAELDYTYSILDSIMTFKEGNGIEHLTLYRSTIKEKSPRIIKNNYLLNNISKSKFLNQRDYIFELRIVPKGILFQMNYPTHSSTNDGKFSYDALVMSDDHTSAHYTHKISKDSKAYNGDKWVNVLEEE